MATEAVDVVLPVGRYRSTPICRVPAEYLVWLLGNVRGLHEAIRLAVTEELAYRERYGAASLGREDRSGRKREALAELLREWRKQYRVREHPDRAAGNHDGINACDRAADDLERRLRASGYLR